MREIRKNREKARRRIIGFESPLARWIDGFPSSSIVSREKKGEKEKKREKREKKKTAVRERTRKPAALVARTIRRKGVPLAEKR